MSKLTTTTRLTVKELVIETSEQMDGPPGGGTPIPLAAMARALVEEMARAGRLLVAEGKIPPGKIPLGGPIPHGRNGTVPTTRHVPADQVARAAEAHGFDPEERLAAVKPTPRARKANPKPRPKRGK